MMKQQLMTLMIGIFALTNAYASSDIELAIPGKGVVETHGGKLTMTLDDGFYQDIYYSVTCKVTNPSSSTIDAQINTNAYSYSPSYYVVNDNAVDSVFKLQPGDNIIEALNVMIDSSDQDDSEKTFGFKNFDFDSIFVVESCVAKILVN